MFKKEILPRINALWRDPLIILLTGLFSLFSVFFSFSDKSGKGQDWCGRDWSRLVFWITRVKLKASGLEKLDPGTGYVFISNHLSIYDIWAILAYVPFHFRFVAKMSLFKVPFLGWHMKRIGYIPVDNRNPRKVLKSYEQAAEKIRNGVSIILYPEGGRSHDGKIADFKRGAFVLPRHAKAPIVPVTIIGSHLRLRTGSFILRPGPMEMILHDPIPWKTYSQWSLQELTHKTRAIILSVYRTEP